MKRVWWVGIKRWRIKVMRELLSSLASLPLLLLTCLKDPWSPTSALAEQHHGCFHLISLYPVFPSSVSTPFWHLQSQPRLTVKIQNVTALGCHIPDLPLIQKKMDFIIVEWQHGRRKRKVSTIKCRAASAGRTSRGTNRCWGCTHPRPPPPIFY